MCERLAVGTNLGSNPCGCRLLFSVEDGASCSAGVDAPKKMGVACSLDAHPPVFDPTLKCVACPAVAPLINLSSASGARDLIVQGYRAILFRGVMDPRIVLPRETSCWI
jgi:hypothetical protein